MPDLGTSLVMLAILVGMIFISGITWKILLPIFGGGAALGSLILFLVVKFPEFIEKYLGVKEYQMGRIYSWLDPYNYARTRAPTQYYECFFFLILLPLSSLVRDDSTSPSTLERRGRMKRRGG